VYSDTIVLTYPRTLNVYIIALPAILERPKRLIVSHCSWSITDNLIKSAHSLVTLSMFCWQFFSRNPTALTRANVTSLVKFRNHTQTHNTRWDSSGRGIDPSHRPLPDCTRHSQQIDILAPRGIWTGNPSVQQSQSYPLDGVATGIGFCWT